MAEFTTSNIRNIALMGHGSEGKTTLMESMLFAAGITDRQGKVEDGTTVSDFDPEEKKRGFSISASYAPIPWGGKVINTIDVPGYFDFAGEMMGPLRVVETAVIVVGGVNGLSVGAEKAWDQAGAHHLGRMFIVNQMDREHANFEKVVAQLREKYGSSVVPILLPLGQGANFRGVVNLLERKAYEGAYKKSQEVPIPADLEAEINESFEFLTEQAAAADDDLMMKYLEGEELTHDEIMDGFRKGMKDGSIVPVVACSALTGVGIARTMDLMAKYLPSPAHEGLQQSGKNPKTGEEVITGSTQLYNANKEKTEKAGGLFSLRGNKQTNVEKLHAGDLGALAKLQFTSTGDTLCDPNSPIVYPQIVFPEPCISKAVFAAKQGEEDKVFSGLNRLAEEDPSIRIVKNTETTETELSGAGEMHLDVIKNKLASKFGANAVLQDPKIPYRETIRKTVKVQGRHKKQTGGHGQFGDVWIEFSPITDKDVDFEFEDAVVGGVVPRNFIPSVEKGLRENIVKGVLAGYPMVHIHAKLYDGSYHPVDSSEMAFKTAARIAYKKGCMEASPVLLEPIMHVEVLVPNEYMGDIMGDMNKRRGRIMGMNQQGNMQLLEAEAPMAEMFKYATDLRSMTQARGSFSMKFERYEEVPANEAQKIIANAKIEDDDEE